MKMTTAQTVETLVTVNNNSPIQDYVHPDDHAQPTYNSILDSISSSNLILSSTLINYVYSVPF